MSEKKRKGNGKEMKKRNLLIAAALSFMPLGQALIMRSTPLLAGGTWIETKRHNLKESSPYFKKIITYIDMNSIVKRGDIIYFNWGTRLLKKDGIVLPKNLDNDNVGDRINCKKKTFYATNGTWTPISKRIMTPRQFDIWNSFYPLVCK